MKFIAVVSTVIGIALCGSESVVVHAAPESSRVEPAVAAVGELVLPAPQVVPAATVRPARGASQPSWVLDKPKARTQVRKSSRQRGVNPCLTPDPGHPGYSRWDRAPSMGQMIVPKELTLAEDGGFDLFVHFHGHESARKEWVGAISDAVLVGIDLGDGSGPYLRKFSAPGEFARLVSSVERGVARRLGVARAKARRIGLSSWSAGYGALIQILSKPRWRERIDAVVLLDGLHVGYSPKGLEDAKLEPFARFATQAADGHKLMLISHSSIIPPDYASTTETANYLIWRLGGRPHAVSGQELGPLGLELVASYSEGGFYARGYAGNDALDHCAQLGVFGQALREYIVPRWQLRH